MHILHHGRLLTRDADNPWFADGAVAFSGTDIIAVGPEAQILASYPQAQRIDAGGGLIVPALTNMHEHAYSALARGLALPGYNPASFADILSGLWWRLDAALNAEDIRLSALLTFLDCLKNGVTTVFDHHASYGAIEDSLFIEAEAAKQAGLRACLCYEVSDRAGAAACAAAVAENARFLAHCQKERNPMLAGLMGLHASFTVSDATLAACREATPTGAGFHLHLAEGPEDQIHCLREHGLRVAARLQRQGILGPQTIAAHGINVDAAEIELLAESGTALIHNPQSNMGNAVGCAPLAAMQAAGIALGLGTDGYTHDMLESGKTAQLLQKHQLRDANAGFTLAADMLFRQNPLLAARHFPAALGQIKPGAAADMIVLDYDPFTPLDATNADGHIMFGLLGRQVRTVLANGRLLMHQGELTCIDEEKICAEARVAARKLWDRM